MFSPGIQFYQGNYQGQDCPYTVAALSAVATGGTFVAAVTAKKTIIHAMYGNGSAAQTLTLVSNAVNKSGAMNASTTLPICMPFNPAGWAISETGYSITGTISSGTFSGVIVYSSFTP